MIFNGLELDKFQEDAVAAIEKNHSVIVSAPTGSGKTLIADYIISREIKKGIKVIYTAPIKALSNQKYKDFCRDYGEKNIGLLTGDTVKNPSANILIMTTEIYRNMLMSDDDVIKNISYVVFDEIHFINDIERGYVWEESIIFSKPSTRFLCLSATIPNADEFADWISVIKNHKVEVIAHNERPVPLVVNFYDYELGISSLDKIKASVDIPDYDSVMGKPWHRHKRIKIGSHIELVKSISDKLPCLFFSFSRIKCEKMANELFNLGGFETNLEINSIVRKRLAESPPEINTLNSTILLKKTLSKGIGFHHAGLIPVLKDIVEELFSLGLIKVLYTTETFAVGINMPAKTVCFETLRKFDGINFRNLSSKEFFQIAGRAGRRGIDKTGYVIPMINRNDFEYSKIKKMIAKDTEPIRSQFKISPNTVLNMIQRHTASEIEEILCQSFDSYQRYGKEFDKVRNIKSHNVFYNLKKKLTQLGYIKEDKLTEKGSFTLKIYSSEFIVGEIFFGKFCEDLAEYDLLLLLACICFESRDEPDFEKVYLSKSIDVLRSKLKKNHYLKYETCFDNLVKMTALISPCFNGKDIFDVIDNTKLAEGDLLRFYRTVLDKVQQVKKATNDPKLSRKMDNCCDVIKQCISLVDVL
jgi:superfamily II RNA helicase